MPIDLIQNISGFGDAADKLMAANFDVGVLRPWIGRDGRSYITRMVRNQAGIYTPKVYVTNAPATLTKDAWIAFDTAIVRAVRDRLRVFADIRGSGLVFNLPNGMAHTILQYQTMGDITPATVSMDPVRRSEGDRPHFDLGNLPLPVVHKDFDFSAREIMVSRNGNLPLDTTMAELAARKVAEEIERMTAGTVKPVRIWWRSHLRPDKLPEQGDESGHARSRRNERARCDQRTPRAAPAADQYETLRAVHDVRELTVGAGAGTMTSARQRETRRYGSGSWRSRGSRTFERWTSCRRPSGTACCSR
jgi:hypothetical protein